MYSNAVRFSLLVRMRVIQLGPYPPPHGGVQTNIVGIRGFLRRHGHQCAVINLTRHRKHAGDDVYYPKSALETAWLLVREAADILHLHIGGNLTLRLLCLGLLCCTLPRRKAVLTFHSGGYPSSTEGRTTRSTSFRGFVIRRFDALVAVNDEIAAFYARCGARLERVRVISPQGPVVADAPLPEPLASFFASHRPVLLSVGQIEPEYDLLLQIEVFGRILRRYSGAGLVMIGSGSMEREVRRAMSRQPWAVHMLLPGDLDHAFTLRAIRECSVLLRTTFYDGDSISVRESLARGTPVIATDNGMRPAGCRLVPVSDAAALEEAILETLTRQAGEGALAPPGEENLEEVLRLYLDLASKKPSSVVRI